MDKQRVECSDNLMSIVSSLRSKLDLVVPGLEPTNDDSHAQVTAVDHQDMSVALSGASGQNSKEAAASSSLAPKRPTTKKRQMEETPEAPRKSPKRSPKRPSASRRHDDSQIQFAVIAPSTRLDESQHLTDRQKEVRERQLENAALYSDIRSDGPAGPHVAVAAAGSGVHVSDGGGLPRDTTPTRNTSFDDLVRSTPTPRRGQVLPVDDANDPPSSPPLPRPCPLLSEIQSRSRAGSSLDNWEFSSPTGSPVTRAKDPGQNVGPTRTAEKAEASPTRLRPRKRRQRRGTGGQETEVIPSSIPEDDQGSTAGFPAGADATNTSFGFSESAANAAVDLVIELESRRYELSASEGGDSPRKNVTMGREREAECILALPESPRGPTTRGESRRLAALAAPFTPSEGSDREAGGGARRKRKRGGPSHAEHGGKRRRSEEAERKSISPTPPSRPGRPVTRRSSRRRRSRTGATAPEAAASPEAKKAGEEKAGEDTDEEVMSQLVTESYAASQKSKRQEAGTKAKQGWVPATDTRRAKAAKAARGERDADESEEGPTILGTLRSGLEQLREAALGRETVYELEDVLMDLRRELYDAEKRGQQGSRGRT